MFDKEREKEIFNYRRIIFSKSQNAIELSPLREEQANEIILMAQEKINELNNGKVILDYTKQLQERVNKLVDLLNNFINQYSEKEELFQEDMEILFLLHANYIKLLLELDVFDFTISENNKKVIQENLHTPENIHIYRGKDKK